MKYYTARPRYYSIKRQRKHKNNLFWILFIIFFVISSSFLYLFDKRIFPAVLSSAEVTMKAEVANIINDESVKKLSDYFNLYFKESEGSTKEEDQNEQKSNQELIQEPLEESTNETEIDQDKLEQQRIDFEKEENDILEMIDDLRASIGRKKRE